MSNAYLILEPDEPAAAQVERAVNRPPFVLACDHAGRLIPRRLGSLGLDRCTLRSHVAWDIGALGVARHLAHFLKAPLVWQAYSRLVVDCNRGPWVADFIPTISEDIAIPSNRSITGEHRHARITEIFQPYHQGLAAILDERRARGQPAVLVAIHSFTPVFKSVRRPWHLGILSHRDRRLASLMLDDLHKRGDLCVGDNEPYSVSDESDYTIPVHGEARGIPHVEIEIRQDLIGSHRGQTQWAGLLAGCLERAWARLIATEAT